MSNSRDDVRQLFITSENDKSLMIDLLDEDAFGADITGLGVNVESDFYYASADALPTNYDYKYNDIDITMIFGTISGEPYAAFERFVRRLSLANAELTLNYRYNKGTTYQRQVMLKTMEKGEIDHKVRWLKAKLKLSPLSPWYIWEDIVDKGSPVCYVDEDFPTRVIKLCTSRGKRYYYSGIAGLNNGKAIMVDTTKGVHLAPKKTVPVFLSLRNSSGRAMDEIELRVMDASGDTISTTKFSTSLPSGSYLTVCSDFRDLLAIVSLDTAGKQQAQDVLATLTTDSTGILRVPAGGKYYLYLGGLSYDDRAGADRVCHAVGEDGKGIKSFGKNKKKLYFSYRSAYNIRARTEYVVI